MAFHLDARDLYVVARDPSSLHGWLKAKSRHQFGLEPPFGVIIEHQRAGWPARLDDGDLVGAIEREALLVIFVADCLRILLVGDVDDAESFTSGVQTDLPIAIDSANR